MGFKWVPIRPTVNRPLEIFTSLTERSRLDALAGAAGAALALEPAPSAEKFQSPAGDCSSQICGWSMAMLVTATRREKMSAWRSTPACSDFASRKAVRLNAGSSAMDKSSAVTPPDRIVNFRFPTFTSRPNAALNRDSNMGRKRLASITKGSAIATNSSAAITMPAIFSRRFILSSVLSRALQNRYNLMP
jgi:hypothetical protein